MPPKFVPRERKHKKLARKVHQAAHGSETNAAELLPTSKDEREERKRILKEELVAQQPPSKTSSKKRKRLEKYVVRYFRHVEIFENCINTANC